jgi:adenosylcobinamide kinase / adenosylcobinamide-phosphate guanylyltransferase
MEVRLSGTGGPDGWPQPDCRCASCARARPAGRRRAPTRVFVDGVLCLDGGGLPAQAPGGGTPGGAGYRLARVPGGGEAAGYLVARVPGGWDVTAPGGDRLLVGDGPGDPQGHGPGDPQGHGPGDMRGHGPGDPQGHSPGDMRGDRQRGAAPPDGARPYDIVLLDLLGNPAQLGALRRRGLIHASTVVAVLPADHRVSSDQELARRCGYWGGVIAPHDGDVLVARADPGLSDTGAAGVRGAGQQGGPGGPRRVLVLGGARSGKSRHAELRLAGEPRVTYLAAGPYPAGARPADAEWAGRVAAHRARRPAWWQTVEGTDVAGILRSESGAVLFDGAGTWLAAVMAESGAWPGDGGPGDGGPGDGGPGDGGPGDGGQGDAGGEPAALARVAARVDEFLAAWRETRARVVAVSDEVGSSVHPASRAGRVFRDQLGWLNQRLAAESEETVLMVAGRVLPLPS